MKPLARSTILDTKTVAPYCWGRFVLRYRWAEEDRCQFIYTYRAFSRDTQVTGQITHSLASGFRWRFEHGKFNPDDPFIRYFFDDEPRAVEVWQQICQSAPAFAS